MKSCETCGLTGWTNAPDRSDLTLGELVDRRPELTKTTLPGAAVLLAVMSA